jgi:crotonobetainyl-CoA:carnitine CoA-transferase CaiB-like acyl-CoA transferase
LLAEVPHPTIPELRLVDLPVSEEGNRADLRRPPPLLGQHTSEILAELGYSDAETAALRDQGIVA